VLLLGQRLVTYANDGPRLVRAAAKVSDSEARIYLPRLIKDDAYWTDNSHGVGLDENEPIA